MQSVQFRSGRRAAEAAAVSLLGLLLTAGAMAQDKFPAFPPPAAPKDTSSLGMGIQRTMTLLATSTPEHRNTVRILFYGQSITEQSWWKDVADDLRRRFPSANLIIENRAIGGFSSQYLVKDAEAALYPAYPDLVIFYVYGSHIEYENIIRRLRERTTAEIVMQTDHVTKDEELTEEEDPAKLSPQNWSAWMNHSFLPATAKKYGAGLLDQRAAWKTYLSTNHLHAAQLLKDGVHLNGQGCYVMAELVKPYLRYRPDQPTDSGEDLVQTDTVGKDTAWKNGHLTLAFEGNRVDIIPNPSSTLGTTARILIDGKKPSEHPELYTFTRTSDYPGTRWPGAMKVGSEAPLQLEEWTARITPLSDDLKRFSFSLTGSKTGPDGEGISDQHFVSKSRRIVLAPEDWSLARSREFTKQGISPGFEIKWKVVPLFQDTYTTPILVSRAYERATPIAQGLTNGKHTLEIISDDGKPLPIQAIRIYHPPLGREEKK
jgi:hypothetical protein